MLVSSEKETTFWDKEQNTVKFVMGCIYPLNLVNFEKQRLYSIVLNLKEFAGEMGAIN